MNVDLPTSVGIVTVTVLCVVAMLFTYNDGQVADLDPLEDMGIDTRYGNALFDIKAQADVYLQNSQHEKTKLQEEIMSQKLKEISRDYLGMNIVLVDITYYMNPGESIQNEPVPSCSSARDIPIHIKNIRNSEWFNMFAEKYSSHAIEMYMYDEGPLGLHYGFAAVSGDGKSASTYFHANMCTNEITDAERYLLSCRDENNDYYFSSSNYDDIVASINLEEFCVIPISPWRQAVYDHVRNMEDTIHQHLKSEQIPKNAESMRIFWQELERMDMLSKIALMAASNNYEDEEIQKNIIEYCNEFGPIPQDLASLIEDKESNKNLSTC